MVSPSFAVASNIPAPLRRLTVGEYQRLVASGALDEGERVELLEGWLAAKMTRRPPHDAIVNHVADLLRERLPKGYCLRVQSAITTSDSEPEPDVAVVRGGPLTYLGRHPSPEDVALLIEVADTSLERDRTVKGRIYARAGIEHYWIMNLVDEWVEVHEQPSGASSSPSYHDRRDRRRGESLALCFADGTVVDLPVATLLPELG